MIQLDCPKTQFGQFGQVFGQVLSYFQISKSDILIRNCISDYRTMKVRIYMFGPGQCDGLQWELHNSKACF